MIYEVYCDGSTRSNGKENAVGGWAYVVLQDGKQIHSQSGATKNSTNQRMELTAAIMALHYLFQNEICQPFDSVKVFTDSAYLHNCFSQQWYKSWQMNGWKNSKKQPVANQDLWEELIEYFDQPEVEFVKVKGHADNSLNNLVDGMAQNASALCKKEKENGSDCNTGI